MLEGLDVGGDQASRQGRLAPGHEQVHPEPRVLVVVVGEIHLPVTLEDLVLVGVEHVLGHLEHDLGRDDVRLKALEPGADADPGGEIGLQMKVRGFILDARGQVLLEELLALPLSRARVVMDWAGELLHGRLVGRHFFTPGGSLILGPVSQSDSAGIIAVFRLFLAMP